MANATQGKKTSAAKATAGKNGTAPKTMSAEHKAKLAQGRDEGRVVGKYLELLEVHKPQRGRQISAEDLKQRHEAAVELVGTAKGLARLKAIQDRDELAARIGASVGGGEEFEAARVDFVKVAASYSARQGVTRAQWRELGVPSDTLKEAGIT